MPPDSAATSQGPTWGTVPTLGALAATIFAAVALARAAASAFPEPPALPFDDLPLRQLRLAQPDFVFLGNSMLRSRIDGPLLDHLIAPDRAALLVENGAASALWYLQLKNTVIASGASPRRVVVFFRDRRLTHPRFHTTGRFHEALERASLPEEPELERILAGSGRAVDSLARRAGAELAPVAGVRDALERSTNAAGTALARALAGPPPGDRPWRDEINALFAWRNLRPDRVPGADEPLPSFEEALPRSFLPAMLRLAAEHDIELFFVHVQKRPPRGRRATHSEAQRAYLEELAAWLTANGAGFRDLTGADWIPESWYGRTDHIDRAHRAEYTRLFRERVPEVFE